MWQCVTQQVVGEYPTHHRNPEGMTLLFTNQKLDSHIMSELNTELHDLFCHCPQGQCEWLFKFHAHMHAYEPYKAAQHI